MLNTSFILHDLWIKKICFLSYLQAPMQYNWESPAGQIASIKKRKKIKYFLTFLQSCPRGTNCLYLYEGRVRVNGHERKEIATHSSCVASVDSVGWAGRLWQLLGAMVPTPGVCVYGQSLGTLTLMQQQQQNEGDIASDPAHYPSLWW